MFFLSLQFEDNLFFLFFFQKIEIHRKETIHCKYNLQSTKEKEALF